MKKLSMTLLVLVALTAGTMAHEGSIGLYTDTSHDDCDADLTPYTNAPITIMYYKSDGGPDGITGAEFKLSVPSGIIISNFDPSPQVSVTLGDIGTGLAVAYSGCTGGGEDYTLIGTVYVMAMGTTPAQMQILASDQITTAPFTPRVSICDETHSIVGVLGGWFTTPDGTCSVGTEETTWGAIKEMYNR